MGGKIISSISRRSKYIFIHIKHKKEELKEKDKDGIIIHLGMTGKIRIEDQDFEEEELQKHDHVVFHLEENSKKFFLVYNDIRRFGLILLISEGPHQLNLGREVWDDDFLEYFEKLLSSKNRLEIKSLIMNNSLISGIGNIYASEILFASKIHPTQKCRDIQKPQIDLLHFNMKKVLEEAIENNGTTIKDYKSVTGLGGGYVTKVYGRKNCVNCNRKIEKFKQNGRMTYSCNFCQRKII